MHKGIDKIIKNLPHVQTTQLTNKSYSYIHIKEPKWPYDSSALNLIGPFHSISKENTCTNVHVSSHKLYHSNPYPRQSSWSKLSRFSLEQNSGCSVDKLSSTTVDFIRSEGELKKTVPYMGSKMFCEHADNK